MVGVNNGVGLWGMAGKVPSQTVRPSNRPTNRPTESNKMGKCGVRTPAKAVGTNTQQVGAGCRWYRYSNGWEGGTIVSRIQRPRPTTTTNNQIQTPRASRIIKIFGAQRHTKLHGGTVSSGHAQPRACMCNNKAWQKVMGSGTQHAGEGEGR